MKNNNTELGMNRCSMWFSAICAEHLTFGQSTQARKAVYSLLFGLLVRYERVHEAVKHVQVVIGVFSRWSQGKFEFPFSLSMQQAMQRRHTEHFV